MDQSFQGCEALSLGHLRRLSLVLAMGGSAFAAPAMAQVIPDASLGTLVNGLPAGCLATAVCNITGGTAAGANLFHSFSEFSIDGGGSAAFRDLPQGTEAIFSRVRNARSLINGELSIEAGSTADLFLMNPNGIVFGPEARLNLQGSFAATTATGLGFGENGAFDMATTASELGMLTVTPSAFLYNQIPQSIQVQAEAELAVAESLPGTAEPNELILAGGNVEVESSVLRAPGGTIFLSGLSEPGQIATEFGNIRRENVTIPNGTARANVTISDGAIADVVAGGGGNLLIFADDLRISDSILCAGIGPQGSLCNSPGNNLGGSDRASGNILFNATGTVGIQTSRLENNINVGTTADLSAFSSEAPSSSIVIAANALTIEQSQVDVSTYGNGNAGAIIFVTESLTNIDNNSLLLSDVKPGAVGDGGGIVGISGSLRLHDNSRISTNTLGQGNAGGIILTIFGNAEVSDNSQISSAVIGGGSSTAMGDAGGIILTSGSLELRDSSFINTSTSGDGNGGLILLTTEQDMVLSDASGIASLSLDPQDSEPGSVNPGDAGLVFLIAGDDLELDQGSFITAATTTNSGAAGVVLAIAEDEISLDNGSAIFSSVLPLDERIPTGAFGGVLTLSNRIVLRDGSFIDVSNFGTGATRSIDSDFGSERANSIATNLSQQAGQLYVLSNQVILADGSALSASSASGQGGEIVLLGSEFTALSENSSISTDGQFFTGRQFAAGVLPDGVSEARASQQGGGNVIIATPILVATPRRDNDITATAFNQTGGNVDLTLTEQLLNIAKRPRRTVTNDINADSEFGRSGTVSTNALDIDPSRSLDDLPDSRLPDLLAEGCRPNGRPIPKDRLYFTELGGLPPNPNDLLRSNLQLAELDGGADLAAVEPALPLPEPQPIVAAQGWIRDESGAVFFSATPAEPVLTASQPGYSSCGSHS